MLTQADREFLSPVELRDLTDYARQAEQREVLDELGIPFRLVRGKIKVSRHHTRLWLEGRPVRASREPDLGAVR